MLIFENEQLEFENITVSPSSSVKLLGVEIDKDLNFNLHVEKLCNIIIK